MPKLSIVKGATSVIVRVFIQDSRSVTGAGLSGLVFNSPGLTCYRMRDDDGNAAATAITLATMTRGTWATSGFVEKDATGAPGWYEFGVPNNAIASGSRSVSIHFQGAANMVPLPLEIELTGVDNQDGVRLGLTALPNAAAEAAGGLYTRGTGAGQINQDANGRIDVNAEAWNTLETVALPLVPTVAGNTLDVTATGAAGIDWGNVENKTTTNSLTNTLVKANDVVGQALATASSLSSLSVDVAALASYVDTEVAAILADTNELQTDWANGGRLDLLLDGVKAKTDGLPADPSGLADLASAHGAGSWATATGFAVAGDAMTLVDVDGMDFETYTRAIVAGLAGATNVNGSVVEFMLRDGVTPCLTITYGSTPGQRTASVIVAA